MHKIAEDYGIDGPITKFIRSPKVKKKKGDSKMSGTMPSIRLQNDDTARNTVKISNPVSIGDVALIHDSESDGSSVATAQPTRHSKEHKTAPPPVKSSSGGGGNKHESKFNPEEYQYFVNNDKHKPRKTKDYSDSESDSGYSGYSGSDYSSGSGSSRSSGSSNESVVKTKSLSKKDAERKKQNILIKLLGLEKKGVELSRKFSMHSKLEDLEFELNLHRSAAESEASVHFQQKILMAAVTGIEFMNKKFDPINAKLEGWSESVMDNITDYDEIFIKLFEKYKTKSHMSPEIQLLITLVGSGFMFHLTQSLFKTAMPNLGQVVNDNPEIMNSISKAMGKSMESTRDANRQNRTEMSGPSLNLSDALRRNGIPQSGGGNSVEYEGSDGSSSIETTAEIVVNSSGKKIINI